MPRGQRIIWWPVPLLVLGTSLILASAIVARPFSHRQKASATAAPPTATSAPTPSPRQMPTSIPVTVLSQSTPMAAANQSDLQSDFARAAKEFGVPDGILLAVSYNESRWEHHRGEPSTDAGYGLMHLTDLPDAKQSGGIQPDPRQHTLLIAAKLLGTSPEILKHDPAQNIRGGAALLAQYARDTVGTAPRDASEWYGAVATYRGSPDVGVSLGFADAIKTFQNPKENLSANYVIRSVDGQVVQMVRNHDVAHHVGNWYVNTHSIGIEHEGVALEGATWYSEPLYQASAKLVRYLAEKYNVPLDRAHIIGHDNVPGLTPEDQTRQHWDPGPFWDWTHYVDLFGAPLKPGADSRILTVAPKFAANTPTVSSRCDANGCDDLAPQAANFVYLRQAPFPNAPLIADSALAVLQTTPGQGTTRADDWGDKAVTGQRFYLADTRGDWDAIWFGGQKAWFYNPGHASTLPGQGTLVTPRKGKAAIPVFGEAYPEASAYPPNVTPVPIVPLQYSIPAGQIYVATGLVPTDYYDAMTYATDPSGYAVVKGQTKYYQIFFNHRLAFVRADDVDTLSGQQSGGG